MDAPCTAIGLIDAATLFGASRHVRRSTDGAVWHLPLIGDHPDDVDNWFFLDFIHNLLLYEKLVVDNSSTREREDLSLELTPLIELVNSFGSRLISIQDFGIDANGLQALVSVECRLLSQIPRDQIPQIRIPWAYSTPDHVDYQRFLSIGSRIGLAEELLPLALFAFRGLVYSARACNLQFSNSENRAVVYLAAPERIKALRVLLHGDDIRRLNIPRQSYLDLLRILNLPNQGLDFGFASTSFEASSLSTLTLSVWDLSPLAAIERTMTLRNSAAGGDLRNQWSKRLLTLGKCLSAGICLPGQGSVVQTVADCVVDGNLLQTVNNYLIGR